MAMGSVLAEKER
jgi:hypothetical protein